MGKNHSYCPTYRSANRDQGAMLTSSSEALGPEHPQESQDSSVWNLHLEYSKRCPWGGGCRGGEFWSTEPTPRWQVLLPAFPDVSIFFSSVKPSHPGRQELLGMFLFPFSTKHLSQCTMNYTSASWLVFSQFV